MRGGGGHQGQSSEGGSRRVRSELRVSLQSVAELVAFREELRSVLAATPLSEPDREAVVLAASEALDNALLACQGKACRVEVVVSLLSGYVCLEIRDAGAGFRGACYDLSRIAGATDEHGRGLHLMHELMESLELVPRSQGTLVRMTKRLPDPESPDTNADPERLAC